MSWNIDHGSRLEQVIAEIQSVRPEICTLQEVDRHARRSGNKDIAKELADRLGMHYAYAEEFEELSQGSEGHPAFIGQATLSKFPIRASRVIHFKRQSNFWQPRPWLPSSLPLMQRRKGERVALVTELDVAGETVIVYNPHLESRSAGPIQMAQLDELLEDMRRYPATNTIILAGDINSKYFPSVYLRKLERAGFHSALGSRIERTHVIAMALDWIFVRGAVQMEDGKVRHADGSDHYPISVRIR